MYPYGTPGTAILPNVATEQAAMQLPKNIIRVGEQALWSSQRYTDAEVLASRQDRVFTTPRGQVGQGFATRLTLPETNLKEGGRIPGGYAYNVFGIACQTYYGDSSGQWAIVRADIANMQNNCVLLWDFLQTTIEVAPLSLIGAGGGVFGDTADTGGIVGGAGGSRVALNNGNGAVWIYRQHPVMLPSDATFAMVLQWGDLASPVDGGPDDSNQIIRILLLGKFQSSIAVG